MAESRTPYKNINLTCIYYTEDSSRRIQTLCAGVDVQMVIVCYIHIVIGAVHYFYTLCPLDTILYNAWHTCTCTVLDNKKYPYRIRTIVRLRLVSDRSTLLNWTVTYFFSATVFASRHNFRGLFLVHIFVSHVHVIATLFVFSFRSGLIDLKIDSVVGVVGLRPPSLTMYYQR